MEIMKALRAQWDRALAIGISVLGLIVIGLGWLGVSGTGYVAEQLPYAISGGIFGLFLLFVGATLWLSADLRDEWRKLDSIDSRLERIFGDEERAEPTPAVEPTHPRPYSSGGDSSSETMTLPRVQDVPV